MATIDDVYNLLVDGGIGLAAINTNVGTVGTAVGAGNPSNAIGILRGQLEAPSGGDNVLSEVSWLYNLLKGPGSTLYDVLDNLDAALVAGGPDTLKDYIGQARAGILDIINGYLKDPPDYDLGSSILKTIKKGVYKTFTTDDT